METHSAINRGYEKDVSMDRGTGKKLLVSHQNADSFSHREEMRKDIKKRKRWGKMGDNTFLNILRGKWLRGNGKSY